LKNSLFFYLRTWQCGAKKVVNLKMTHTFYAKLLLLWNPDLPLKIRQNPTTVIFASRNPAKSRLQPMLPLEIQQNQGPAKVAIRNPAMAGFEKKKQIRYSASIC